MVLSVAVLVAEVPQAGVTDIVQAHEQLGHRVRIVSLDQVVVTADRVIFPGGLPDVCHSRASALWGLTVQKRLEQVVPIVNTVAGQWAGRDKWVCAQRLVADRVPAPSTMLIVPGVSAATIVDVLGDDVVVKPVAGHSGQGVIRVTGLVALEAWLAGEPMLPMVAQPFIRAAAGTDLRVMVVGGEPLYVLQRSSGNQEEFRANASLGGSVKVVPLTDKVAEMAVRATIACRLDIAGVDVTVDRENPLVIEVNTNAGIGSQVHLSSGFDAALESARLVARRA